VNFEVFLGKLFQNEVAPTLIEIVNSYLYDNENALKYSVQNKKDIYANTKLLKRFTQKVSIFMLLNLSKLVTSPMLKFLQLKQNSTLKILHSKNENSLH